MPADAGSGKAVGRMATMNATAAAVNQKRRVGMTGASKAGVSAKPYPARRLMAIGSRLLPHRPLVMRNGVGLQRSALGEAPAGRRVELCAVDIPADINPLD